MGTQSTTLAPFGHSANMPQTIDGLDLLKTFLDEQQAQADPAEAEDEWAGWDVESDSESESSESGSWIAVDSDGPEELNISDSEDEAPRASISMGPPESSEVTPNPQSDVMSMELATTKV